MSIYIVPSPMFRAINNQSGGEVWELLDLSNLPSDFAVGDMLRIDFSQGSAGYISSWTTAPANNPSLMPYKGNIVTIEIINSNATPSGIVYYMKADSGGINVSYLGTIQSLSEMNSNTHYMFYLSHYIFNGAGIKFSSTQVNASNITSYVRKMWRLKK